MEMRKRDKSKDDILPKAKNLKIIKEKNSDSNSPKVIKKKQEVTRFKIENFLNDEDWKNALKKEFEKEYFINLNAFLDNEYKQHLPKPNKEPVFNAFNLTKLHDVYFKYYVIDVD
jgi:hypothetical protein